MPRIHAIHTNFTAGEFSPLLEGRVDLDKYTSAVKELKNMVIMPHGGATRRGGWHLCEETYDSALGLDKRARLIPFEYSSVQAYMLEFGENYIRFYMDGYQIQTETGDDLVINGNFDIDLTGWTVTAGVVWGAATMQLTGTGVADAVYGWQTLTTVAGHRYILAFNAATDPPLTLRIGSTVGGQQILADTEYPLGNNTVAFTALGVATTIRFSRDSAVAFVAVDNVSCYEWIPYQIVSPYFEDDLDEIRYVQNAENLYLVHPDYTPAILTRSDHDKWTLFQFPYEVDDGPYRDEVTEPEVQITSSAIGVGAQTWTAGANHVVNGVFGADTDWDHISTGTGSSAIAAGVCTLLAGAGPGKGWIEQDFATVVGVEYYVTFTITNGGGYFQVGTATTLHDVCDPIHFGIGATQHLHFVATSAISYIQFYNTLAGTTCTLDNVSCWPAVFDTGHEGTCWRHFNTATWGWASITTVAVTSHHVATVNQIVALGGVTSTAWCEAAWSDVAGYPCTVTFNEDRIVFGGTETQKQTVWASAAGDYENFTPGVLAADPFTYTIASGKVDLIRWMCSAKKLMVGTMGVEYTMEGESDETITPTNVKVESQATYGSSDLQPLHIGNSVIFLQAAGRKVRELAYNWESDSYSAPDLSLLAEHLVYDGVVDMAYQQEPYSIVWCLTSAGLLLGMTYERSQNIVGWHQHPTGPILENDVVESIAVIPDPYLLQDQLWAIINRDIGGVHHRFIEIMDETNYTDCCLTYSGTATTVIYGADHLIGETVDVVGDGAVYPQAVVAGDGSVTLDGPAALNIEVGLPFTSKILSLRPEVPIAGTSQGIKKHWSRIWVRLFESIGVTINGELVEFRTPDDLMDEGIGVCSEDAVVSNLGRDSDARITIEQTQPLPFTVICFFGTIDIGD